MTVNYWIPLHNKSRGLALGRPECKALHGRERHGSLSLLVRGRHVSATLRDVGHHTPRIRQTQGMRQLLRHGQGILEAGPGLRRVPQQPESPRSLGSADHAQVLAHAEHQRPAVSAAEHTWCPRGWPAWTATARYAYASCICARTARPRTPYGCPSVSTISK